MVLSLHPQTNEEGDLMALTDPLRTHSQTNEWVRP